MPRAALADKGRDVPEELEASGWSFTGVRHGFAPRDQTVAAGFHLVRARQVHGATILDVGAGSPCTAGEADGLISSAPGVAVAIATADCVPILLVAPGRRVVAAVHAGWRGTLAGITGEALSRLAVTYDVPAAALQAALGPSIDGCCFEVEREIAARFADRIGSAVWGFWRDGRPGKGTLDLRGVNRHLLLEAGLRPEAIQQVGPCTACGGGPFASYRKQGPGTGRQLSWIGLEAGPA